MNIFSSDGISFIAVIQNEVSFYTSGKIHSNGMGTLVDFEVMAALAEVIVKHKADQVKNHDNVLTIQPGYDYFNHEHLTYITVGSGANVSTLKFKTLELLQQIAGERVQEFLQNIPLLSSYKD